VKGDFRIGHWLIEPTLNRISQNGATNHLEPKIMQVLVCLARAENAVVSKQQLIDEVWKGTFVTDDVLTRAISVLREAFGDDARDSQIIQTIPKQGYRLLLPVGASQSKADEDTHKTVGVNPTLLHGIRRHVQRWVAGIAVGAVLLVVAGYYARQRFWPTAKPPAGKIMLAVMPFHNLSGDPEQEYLSDGLTEEMIAQLGSLHPRRLGVIARASVMRYKNSEKPIDQIGRELNVTYVLEGSVRRAGPRLRITAQLIQVSDQTHLWAENYEREHADILGVQSDVAQRVARSMALELLPAEERRIARAHRVNPVAHEAYLKGRMFWTRRGRDNLNKGLQYFQEAIAKDPEYAPAYTGLADSYTILAQNGWVMPKDVLLQAKEAARKALELDPGLAEAHVSQALVMMVFEWDFPGADRELQRAIELNPTGFAHHMYGNLLTVLGQTERAIAEARRARELDPLAPRIAGGVGIMLYHARRYDEALKELQASLELDPNQEQTHEYIGSVCLQQGRYEEAFAAFQKGFRGLGLAYAFVVAGRRVEAMKLLREIKDPYEDPLYSALVYASLGNRDRAFAVLERAYDRHTLHWGVLKADPQFDILRSDPRYVTLMRRVGLQP
jgi:TolB-like protein/DNA-binding winged helix-turn-helix (wHTH) protein/tetratricopeptide (TPR) repeat protein